MFKEKFADNITKYFVYEMPAIEDKVRQHMNNRLHLLGDDAHPISAGTAMARPPRKPQPSEHSRSPPPTILVVKFDHPHPPKKAHLVAVLEGVIQTSAVNRLICHRFHGKDHPLTWCGVANRTGYFITHDSPQAKKTGLPSRPRTIRILTLPARWWLWICFHLPPHR